MIVIDGKLVQVEVGAKREVFYAIVVHLFLA